MPIEHRFNADSTVRHIRMYGHVTEDEIRAYREALQQDQRATQVVSYVDMSELEKFVGFNATLQHSNTVAKLADKRERPFKEIIYAPSDLAYGSARMYQSLMAERVLVEVFKDQDAAEMAINQFVRNSH